MAATTLVVMVMALLTPEVDCADTVTVTVDTSKAIHDVGSMFLGVTLDSSQIRNHWDKSNLRDPTVQAMAKALSPSYLRVGGTSGDTVVFDSTSANHSADHAIHMTVQDWEQLNEFVAAANWSLIFGMNALIRNGHNWDPANARQLLDLSQRKGYHLAGLELGNEPNLFPRAHNATVTPEQLAHDFSTLLGVRNAYPAYKSALVLGPDTAGLSTSFITKFLDSGGAHVVDVVTFHHYYMDGHTAKLSAFTSVHTLESLRSTLQSAVHLMSAHAHGKQLWLGETSSAYGGGAPHISDRYVASFLWLDKLGMAAQMGLQGVMRQAYYGGNYGLLNSTHQPTSDYWVTLLYKRLVGGRVLSVSTSDSSHHTRVYAHCARNSKGVVLFAMNLNSHSVQLELSSFHGATVQLYLLSPDGGDLASTTIRLNGKVLAMNGLHLPPLSPTTHHGQVTLAAHQMAFLEVDGVSAPACSGAGGLPFG